MKLRHVALFICTIGLGIFLLTFLTSPKKTDHNTQNKLHVTTSFYPLQFLAQEVGKDNLIVTSIVPAGVEPHDFEPKPQDITNLLSSDLLIYNGAGFETWIDKLTPDLQKENIQLIDASQDLVLLPQESGYDPHIWLDPVLAIQITDKITQAFITSDPQNQASYEVNAADLKTNLTQLHNQFNNLGTSCARSEIITSHNAFGYLASRYGFVANSISGLSPDEEPSPQKLAELVELAKQKNIKYIFYESLISPRISATIAQEVGAQTLLFNPIEGLTDEEIAQGQNYITIQQQNLANLKIALECQ